MTGFFLDWMGLLWELHRSLGPFLDWFRFLWIFCILSVGFEIFNLRLRGFLRMFGRGPPPGGR
jgi:hypothetical protein